MKFSKISLNLIQDFRIFKNNNLAEELEFVVVKTIKPKAKFEPKLNFIRSIIKKFIIIFIISFFITDSYAVDKKSEQKIENFYKHKNCKVAEDLLSRYDERHNTNFSSKYSNHNRVTGYLAGIFLTDPSCSRVLIKSSSKFSDDVKSKILISLFHAERKDIAEEYAKDNNLYQKFKSYEKTNLIEPIKSTVPESSSSANNLIIGAYQSTGDIIFIDNIPESFEFPV